jgi:hypothetical protein
VPEANAGPFLRGFQLAMTTTCTSMCEMGKDKPGESVSLARQRPNGESAGERGRDTHTYTLSPPFHQPKSPSDHLHYTPLLDNSRTTKILPPRWIPQSHLLATRGSGRRGGKLEGLLAEEPLFSFPSMREKDQPKFST